MSDARPSWEKIMTKVDFALMCARVEGPGRTYQALLDLRVLLKGYGGDPR